jgi:hypothetical protein
VVAGFSAPVQTGPGAHPDYCTMGTGSFPWVESGRGVTLTPHPLLVPRSKKQSGAIPLPSLRVFVACKNGETYLLTIDTAQEYVFFYMTFVLTIIVFYIWSRDSVVNTVTRPRATQPRNRGSTSSRDNRMSSSPGRPDGLCGPSNLL